MGGGDFSLWGVPEEATPDPRHPLVDGTRSPALWDSGSLFCRLKICLTFVSHVPVL